MTEAILDLRGVRKEYRSHDVVAHVLHGVDFALAPGEIAALVGPSGSGKSTLLNILGLLDRPTSGSYRVRGVEVAGLDDAELTRLRGSSLGFVFQFHHLIPSLTAEENVMLPLAIATGTTSRSQRTRARELLDSVGLAHKAGALASQLSGGQQQRVAIARALVHTPPLVLADEPTGNLDTETSAEVFALIRRIHVERGTAFLIVTHDPHLAASCERQITLVDGRVAADVRGTRGSSHDAARPGSTASELPSATERPRVR